MTKKTVVITGSGSGIGQALALVFAKNNWETIALPHKKLDVTIQKSIDEFVEKLKGKPVDVLINNAGVYDYSLENNVGSSTLQKSAYIFLVNTIGPKILAEALMDNLKKGNEKLVVSISSVMGTHATLNSYSADHWSYSASKAALNFAMISFTLANPEIKSVLIHPGWVKTKIGGEGATLEPGHSAEKIFELIADHKKRLPNKKIVDYQGKIMEF